MLSVVIVMAGEGARFSSAGFTTPKPLIKVNGITLVEHSIATLGLPADRYIFVTREYENPKYNEELERIFSSLCANYTEIRIKHLTSGAAETALYAEPHVPAESSLVVTNADQYFDWDPLAFMEYLDAVNPTSCVGIYNSSDPKNSFAEISNNKVTRITEKDPISDNALTGFHYWATAKDFFESAKKLVSDYKDAGHKESYVSLTYNYLIESGIDVYTYHMQGFHPLGTPLDIENYLNEH